MRPLNHYQFRSNERHQMYDLPVKQKNRSIINRILPNNFKQQEPLQMLENVIGKVYQILKYIEKSGPYIEKYSPIIKEMPTMYKVMKTINELENKEKESNRLNIQNKDRGESIPKLYI